MTLIEEISNLLHMAQEGSPHHVLAKDLAPQSTVALCTAQDRAGTAMLASPGEVGHILLSFSKWKDWHLAGSRVHGEVPLR